MNFREFEDLVRETNLRKVREKVEENVGEIEEQNNKMGLSEEKGKRRTDRYRDCVNSIIETAYGTDEETRTTDEETEVGTGLKDREQFERGLDEYGKDPESGMELILESIGFYERSDS